MRKIQLWSAAGLAATALTLTACGSSGSSAAAGSTPAGSASSSTPSSAQGSSAQSSAPAAAAGGTALQAATVSGTKVVTNAKGFVLYWFVPDTSTASKCTGSCATYWPPVTAPATAGSGVTGTLGSITRADGSKQATYDGHPLYTYAGDTAPGEAKGNGLNVSGGVWHEMTVSAATLSAAPAASPSATSSAKSGYGY